MMPLLCLSGQCTSAEMYFTE